MLGINSGNIETMLGVGREGVSRYYADWEHDMEQARGGHQCPYI